MIKLKDILAEIDYHSKLSRGHKPDYYQLGTSEFKPFDEDMEENVAPDHDGKAAPYGSGYEPTDESFDDSMDAWPTGPFGKRGDYGDYGGPWGKGERSKSDFKKGPGKTPTKGIGHGRDEEEKEDDKITGYTAENFADGKKPGRKGLSKRVGVSQKMTIAQLEKIAKTASGERKRMAQWNLNMKRGRKKK